jgi:hypothetical protein
MRVLWLCGPPGVGKSTTGMLLYDQLDSCGFVDIDQIGMSYPERADDPGRHILKARALAAILPQFRDADLLVVAGVLDPRLIGFYAETIGGLRLCRLRLPAAELRRRNTARGNPGPIKAILREAAEMDRVDAPIVDCEGLSPQQVVDCVLSEARVSIVDAFSPAPVAAAAAPGRVLLLCDPTSVGQSAAGWAVFTALLDAGYPSAYVDLRDIGFLHPADDRMRATNLAALWSVFHDAGARHLVVFGAIDDPGPYEDALPAADLTVHRLPPGELATPPGQVARQVLKAAEMPVDEAEGGGTG